MRLVLRGPIPSRRRRIAQLGDLGDVEPPQVHRVVDRRAELFGLQAQASTLFCVSRSASSGVEVWSTFCG